VDSLHKGVVRILRDYEPVGTGTLVSDSGLVVTCSHVVLAARGTPGSTIQVEGYFDSESICARVDADVWRTSTEGDLAILHLERLPVSAVPMRACGWSGHRPETLLGFGFPSREGLHTKATVLGTLDAAPHRRQRLQLEASQIIGGFSGGPLFDETNACVVGIIQAIGAIDQKTGHNQFTAYSQPMGFPSKQLRNS
jgi:hypothetical protein